MIFSTGPLATTFNGLGLIKKIETGVQFSDGNFGGHLHPDVKYNRPITRYGG